MPTARRLTSIALLTICCAATAAAQQIDCYFSPRGGAAAAICKELRAATRSIRIAAYRLSHPSIARELIDARRRGVAIAIIVDVQQQNPRRSLAPALAAARIPVMIDAGVNCHHNKFLVIDEQLVITGSFNFTTAADTRNAENIVIIRDPPTAAKYLAYWRARAAFAVAMPTTASRFQPPAPPQNKEP